MDDPTFAWRAPIGVLVLLGLALRDRVRTGTWDRARELTFLFGVTAIAVAYAVTHDAVTWRISVEYFVIGKQLPEAARSFAPVARLAALAGWSAGLAVGLALLVANNPSPTQTRLGERDLAIEALGVLVVSACTATLGALVGLCAAPHVETVLRSAGIGDARAFAIVQGIHLGTYVGAALGAVRAVVRVRRARLTRGPATAEPFGR